MHLHEVDAHEEGLRRTRVAIEIFERGFLDVAIKKRNSEHTFTTVDDRRIDVLAVDLELFLRRLPRAARHPAFGYTLKPSPQILGPGAAPRRIAVGAGIGGRE